MNVETVDAVQPSEPWLRLRLLGGCEFQHPDGPLHPETAKTGALLAYLAMQSGPQQRHKLMGLLWGDLPEPNARRNLRRALWDLRRKLDRPDASPFILAIHQTVEFNRQSDYWLDVEVFERELRELNGTKGIHAPSSSSSSSSPSSCAKFVWPGSLQRALELYRGDFLDGFYVHGAPAFEEWVLAERERLRTLVLLALQQLVQHHAARGEYAAGIEYAARLLAMDPWREEAHCELMRLLALTGQRSAALAQYEECRRLLETELGLEPLEETTALYERIRDGEMAHPITPSSPLLVSPSPPLPFVGRGEEHGHLVTWWEAARRGQGGLALVEGEAGVGKTRLVEEVARYAEAQGATVLRGRCYEFGGGVPYQPIAEALRAVLRQGDQGGRRVENGDAQKETSGKVEKKKGMDQDRLRSLPFSLSPLFPFSLPPVWLAELSRLLPEVRQMWPDLPSPVEISGEASRQRLFEAVARFLLALARTADVGDSRMARSANPANPLFFPLDDLHWADPSTLDLLHYLVRNLSAARVWIVGTYRPEEVSLSHPLTRLRQALSRDHLVDRLALEPLPPEAVGQIACSLVGEREGGVFGIFLYRESEGNPFILTETVSDLQEQGALCRGEDGLWQWAGPPAAELALSKAEGTLPAGVQDVVLQRVGRLREPAQRLLTLAAVIGRQFDIALLQAAAGPDADAVDKSLDEWLTRRLVKMERGKGKGEKEQGAGGRGQGAICNLQTCNRPLSTLHSPTSDLHSPFSILHSPSSRYDFSHDKIRAVVYHAAGGRQPMLHRRVGEALEGLYADRLEEACEQLAHHFEQAGVVDKAATYLPLAATRATAVYAHQEALDCYDRALALLGERDERRWEILLPRGRVLRFLGRYDEAIADCQQVVEAGAGDAGNRLLAAQAATELSMIYRAHCDYDEAQAWGKRAYRLAEKRDEGLEPAWLKEQARAKQMLGEIEREQGNLEIAQGLFEEVLALHRELGDQRGEAACLNRLGHVFSDWGRYDAARQRLEEALDVFQALGDQRSEANCLRIIGFTHWRQGANDAAQRAFAESLDICRAIGDRPGEARCLRDLGLAYIAREDYDETRRYWEESVALYRSLDLEKRAAHGLHNLGILYEIQGRYATAQRCLEESLAVHRAIGARSRQAADLGWLGKLHLLRGEYEEARHCLKAAIALDREVGGSAEEPWHRAWLGAAAYETGDLVRAQDHFRQAVRLAEKRGVNLGSFEVSWLVALHLAQGDGEAALSAARQMLAEAGTQSMEMGVSCALLGAVHGSGLLAEAEDPAPYFEQALALLRDGDTFAYGVALRRYGAYLLTGGSPEQGQAHLREAQALFERIGAKGELAKVNRLLASDDSPRLRW